MRNSQLLKYVRRGIGLVIGGIFFILCSSCHKENVPHRGAELCEQMKNVMMGRNTRLKKIDSLMKITEKLSPAEHYSVLFYGAGCYVSLSEKEKAANYIQQLDSLSFPEIQDKTDYFILLECYANIGEAFIDYAPQLIVPEKITSILFDMENRCRLTPQEHLHFLEIKSKIYFNIFKEYKSAITIINDAFKLAQKYGTDSSTALNLYRALFRYSMYAEKEELKTLINDDFAEFVVSCQSDSSVINSIYQLTGMLYERQGNYQKAYDFLKKGKVIYSETYNPILLRIYVELDSLTTALAYIDQARKKIPHPLLQAHLAWDDALIRQKLGDSLGYKRSLYETIELSSGTKSGYVDKGAAVETYARILWQQGKRSEAIRQLEKVTDRLKPDVHNLANQDVAVFDDLLMKMLNPFLLLRYYYYYVGRTADGSRQTILCDSLKQQIEDVHLRVKQQKWQAAIYMKDLTRNLELQTREIQQKQQKLYFIYLIVGLMVIIVVILYILYHQREHQLNVLYARQKEMELLQAEKQRQVEKQRQARSIEEVTEINEQVEPEEELFRKLEQQFYEEELFRNPGFSRDDLCRLGGSNRMYISTCINKYTGSNINQWINKARINYAIRKIGEGECDLTKLSEESGFASIKSFFRSFKQFTNLSPRQYIVREKQAKK